MFNRLQLIALMLCISFNLNADEFADFMKENQQGVSEQKANFDSYQKAYLAEYQQYKDQILKKWDEARISSPKKWVTYSGDMKTRTTVDYENNTVEVAVRNDAKPTAEKIKKQIERTLNTSAKKAVKQDPILSRIEKKTPVSIDGLLMSGLKAAKDVVKKVMATAMLNISEDSHGGYAVTTVKMPSGSEAARIRQLFPYVKKYANKYDVSPPLIFAIIKTESAFNPLAQSHIPAFGLMQIVPSSAGKDVQRLIYNKDRKPSSKMLFNPEINIEHGVAYLHILQTRYLKGITNKKSLEYCSIAAYNTGAGNVAYAFNGTTNIKKAIPKINNMGSDAVYMMLRKNLKYEEAQNYVFKVRKNKQQFMI
jgi:membrane-bound lytic murein transglycosylase C